MLLFPSKQIAPSNYHYKIAKVQKSSLQLSCIRISLSFSIFIRLQLWSWNFSRFTSDGDIFWKANEKVPSSVSMLSNYTHQKKKKQKAPGPSGREGLSPQLSAVFYGLPGGTGKGAKRFSSAELSFLWSPSLFHHVMLLKPRSSCFFLFPNLPFENKIIHTVAMN